MLKEFNVQKYSKLVKGLDGQYYDSDFRFSNKFVYMEFESLSYSKNKW